MIEDIIGSSFNQLYLGFATFSVILMQWHDMAENRKPVTWWRIGWALLGNVVAVWWAVSCWSKLAGQ